MIGHVKKGRVFKSPLMATGLLIIGNWVKDDLPDLLWPALVLAEQGDASMRKFVKWQKDVQDSLAHHGDVDYVAEQLDGRLTSLARLSAKFPDAADVVVQHGRRHGLLSTRVQHVLAAYPFRPAPWLAGETSVESPGQSDLDLVAAALVSAIGDDHREALIKCMRTWSTVHAGTFRADGQTIELLKDYPVNSSKRAAADTVVRAQWSAHKGLVRDEDPNPYDDAIKWARVFWGVNSITTMCIRKRDIARDDDSLPGVVDSEPLERDVPAQPAAMPTPAGGENLRQFTMDVLSSFVEALETAPAHLYENQRQEVVSGLVARAGRDLIAVLSAPDLWCLEHGAHIGRMLVEIKIYVRWMAQQDLSIYRKFQEYGAGKAKLYARIVDEAPAEARVTGFDESMEELKRLSHNDDVLDYRTVDTRDTFADGKSIRVMADEAGLLDFYRQAYSLSSGVAHSEWWSVETHAMERCANVLHGGHQIPSMSLNPGGNVELATSWVDLFYSVVRDGLRILGTDNDAVTSAFSWMSDDDDHEAETQTDTGGDGTTAAV